MAVPNLLCGNAASSIDFLCPIKEDCEMKIMSNEFDKTKVNLFCKICLLFSFVSWLIFGFSAMLLKWSISVAIVITCLLLWSLSAIIGICCLTVIKFKYHEISKRLRQIILWSTISCVIPIAYFAASQVFIRVAYRPYLQSEPCREQITVIAAALIQYADKHDGYLPAEGNWCSILIKRKDVSEKLFVCPNSKSRIGQSSYMMNKHLLGLRLDELSDYDESTYFKSG